jgi:hypothetical protein
MRRDRNDCRTRNFRGEFLWAGSEERDGGKPGTGGFTEWAVFAPEARVYTLTRGKCFHVRLSEGHARLFILYNQGEKWGENILAHERYHVTAHMEPAYRDYRSAATALGWPCMSKLRAERIRAVILGQLRQEYVARSYREGTRYDWDTYGKHADPETRRDSWCRMMTWARRYAAARRATAAACRLTR